MSNEQVNNEQKTPPEIINSISRAIRILNLYVELDVEYLGIADISKHMNLHKTTVFRIMKTLEHEGWIKQNKATGKYKVGLKILNLTAAVVRDYDNHDLILDAMHSLGERFNEDVVLGMVMDDAGICVEKVKSRHNLEIASRTGYAIPLQSGATGKVLLAYQPDAFIARLCDGWFDDSPGGRAGREALLEAVRTIRQQGYCVSTSELDLGVTSITVPLFDGRGRMIHSLGLVGAEGRMIEKGIDTMLDALRESADSLQRQIALLQDQ